MSHQPKADMSYFMPLSSGCSPKDGPSKSIFSVPKFNYSPATKDIVKSKPIIDLNHKILTRLYRIFKS